MADVMTSEQRHAVMQRIRSSETKPEIMIRKWLYAHGIRYRKNDRSLPGTPDIVVSNGKIIVFVNGCFWHGHEGCPDFVIPKTRTDWWLEKINGTRLRDSRNNSQLVELGWSIVTIWECEIKRDFDNVMNRLLSCIQKRRTDTTVKHP